MLPDGVHRLELPTPFAIGPVSCYVLRGEPLTLVDPGPLRDKTRAALDDGLRALGLRVEDVELVVVTHQHHDHAGLAAEIVRRSGARLATSPRLAAYLADYERAMDRDDAYSVAMMRRHGIDDDVRATLDDISRSFRRYGEGAAVDVVVGDGEQLVAGGRTFTAYERPGHSPTDTIFADAGRAARRRRPSAREGLLQPDRARADRRPRPGRGRDAGAAPRRSSSTSPRCGATAAMDVSVVLPGHGEPFADHRALVATREEMHARRARRILRSVDGTRTAADMIGVLWRALPVTQHYLALSEVLGHLDLLAADGLVAAGGARRRGRHVGAVSSSSVTGPSLTSSTSIIAPKTPRSRTEPLAEALVQRLGVLGPRGGDVARAVALSRVAVERELADAQDLAVAERLVHPPLGVGEHAQRADLVGEAVAVGGGVVVRDAEQDEEAGADRARRSRRRRAPRRATRAAPARGITPPAGRRRRARARRC